MCVDILRLTCSEQNILNLNREWSKLPITFQTKQKNQPCIMPLTVAVTGHQISVTKNPTGFQLGCFAWRLVFICPKPLKGVPNPPKKNMTNQYESPSPGIRWSHSPFLRTSISQCLGGHVPGRDGDSPPFHICLFLRWIPGMVNHRALGGLVHRCLGLGVASKNRIYI